MKFNWFFGKNNNNNNNDGDTTGGAANIDSNALTDADFSADEDFFIDIESWGERIAIK